MRFLFKGDFDGGTYAPGSICRFPDGVLRVRTYEETWEPIDLNNENDDDSSSS